MLPNFVFIPLNKFLPEKVINVLFLPNVQQKKVQHRTMTMNIIN